MLHLEHVSPAILEWDAELRLSRWSRRAEQLFGWNAREVIGLRPEEAPFLVAPDGAALRLALERMIAGGTARDGSFRRVRTRTEGDRACAWISYPLTDRTGRTISVISMVHETAGSPMMEPDEPGSPEPAARAEEKENFPGEDPARNPRQELTEERSDENVPAMLRQQIAEQAEALVQASRLLLETALAPAQWRYAEQLHTGGCTILKLLEAGTSQGTEGTAAAILRGRRLLLVDENGPESLPLLRQLQHLGMVTVTVPSADIALELLAQGVRFDASIIDGGLPGTDLRRLRALATGSGNAGGLPILLRLSSGGTIARTELSEIGPVGILEEPIEPSTLAGRLLALLAHPEPETTMHEQPSLNILIAEDTPVNQRVTVVMLEKLGYHPDVAGNGHEVLAALWRKRYDVILMDVEMPEMDGLAATARIRREFPHDRQPRIIAMTANAMEGYRTFCLESGMDGYLTKPVSREELKQALRHGSRPDAGEQPPGRQPAGRPDEEKRAPASYLESLRTTLGADDPAALGELIDQYLGNTAESIVYLRRKYAERNTTELARIAHSLKSSSRIFGAVRLSELFAELERAGHACALELVDDLLTAIVAEFQLEGKRLEKERG